MNNKNEKTELILHTVYIAAGFTLREGHFEPTIVIKVMAANHVVKPEEPDLANQRNYSQVSLTLKNLS